MITISWVVMKHHKRADGTFNPKIRISQGRQSVYMQTGICTKMVRFPKGSGTGVVTDGILIDKLNNKVAQIRSILNDKEEYVSSLTAAEIKAYILRRQEMGDELDFFAFADKYIKTIKNDGTRYYHESRLRTLSSFIEEKTGVRKLPIKRITSKLITEYAEWLRTSKKRRGGGCGLAENTIDTYVRAISTLLNAAKLEYNDYDTGDILIKNDPFKVYKSPRVITRKRALPVEVVRSIADYRPTTRSAAFAKDMFLLSFCLAGMNLADIFECEPFTDRIEYTRRKTRTHKHEIPFISLPIHPIIAEVVEKYKDRSGERGFSLHLLYSSPSTAHQSLHYGMTRMSADLGIKGITMYAARHSFATIARNDCGVSMDDVALCLTHDSGHSITDTYIKRDFSRVDAAIYKVIGFVFGEIG